MGRTTRSFERLFHVFRRPRGRRRALQQQARRKAIPPSNFDELASSPEYLISTRAATRMLQAGLAEEEIVSRLRRRFEMPSQTARAVVRSMGSDQRR